MIRSEATLILITILSVIIGVGTVFFRIVEGWSWIDALFFTVVTLSTVGYGNLVPATVLGKLGTIVFIFAGLGVFAALIQQVSSAAFQNRLRAREELRKARQRAAEAEKRATALQEKGPDA